jgi:hypothetical protein
MSIRPSKALKPSFSADDRVNRQSSESSPFRAAPKNEGGCLQPTRYGVYGSSEGLEKIISKNPTTAIAAP